MSLVPQDRKRGFLPETLRSVTAFTSNRPWGTIGCVLFVSVLCLAVTVQFIQFKTKRSDLIDPDAPFHQRWIHYTESFGEASDMVVVVESEDPVVVRATLDDIAERLRREPELFEQVLYKVDLRPLRRKGLQYLSPDQLEVVAARLSAYSPILQGHWELIRLDSLADRLRLQMQDLIGQAQPSVGGSAAEPAGSPPPPRISAPEQKGLQELIRHAFLLSVSLEQTVRNAGEFRSPWPSLLAQAGGDLAGAPLEEVYLTSDDGKIGFMKVKPVVASTGFAGPAEAIDRIRQILAEVGSTRTDARIGLTGIPVLESDEMRKSQEDMLKASVISMIGVVTLLVIGLRGVRHPLLAFFMLAVGMAWSFGYTTLTVGHLNILSVSFAVILIGLGIDFAIHYIARYLQLRHEGLDWQPALLEASEKVGVGIVTAAVTTAFAFFCAVLTDFLGVAELGIIAGGGILLCAVATFIVVPALVALADSHVEPKKLPTPFQGNSLRWLTSRYPFSVIVVSAGTVLVISLQAFGLREGELSWKVRYDSNLLNLQADGLESVETERRIAHNAHGSLLFAVSLADSAAEARRRREQFETLPTVSRVEELGSRLPAFPPEQTQLLVQAIHSQLARLDSRLPEFGVLDPSVVGAKLEDLFLLLRTVPDPFAQNAARALDRFLDGLERLGLPEQVALLGTFQMQMAHALLAQFQALAAMSDPEPVTLEDFPPELVSRFVSSDGKWLVQVFPRDPVWDSEPLSRFVADVRSVDPDVTGTPLQNFEASRQILASYRAAAGYALVAIGLILLIDFLGR
ncbi:MAG TPA: hypothetical protein EYP14_01400, partial [Planctomycetaceae bacterium]|nr:hypothetical protein [Planctomycetaceae bacterium]